jgi:hypothetical protein
MESARKWKEHTATQGFAEAFMSVCEQYKEDDETRSVKLEEFLIEQALAVGVARRKIPRIAANPNRWAKHLAPWYNDQCREAKWKYKQCKKVKGKKHKDTLTAYQHFK